jgi:hypothetical protein
MAPAPPTFQRSTAAACPSHSKALLSKTMHPTPDVPPQSSDLFLICGIPSAAYQWPSPPRPIPLERCCSPHQRGSASLDRRIRVSSNCPPRPRGRTPLPQGELVSKFNADFRIVIPVVRLLASEVHNNNRVLILISVQVLPMNKSGLYIYLLERATWYHVCLNWYVIRIWMEHCLLPIQLLMPLIYPWFDAEKVKVYTHRAYFVGHLEFVPQYIVMHITPPMLVIRFFKRCAGHTQCLNLVTSVSPQIL